VLQPDRTLGGDAASASSTTDRANQRTAPSRSRRSAGPNSIAGTRSMPAKSMPPSSEDGDRWALRGADSVATWPWLRGRTLPDLRRCFTTAAMCFESVALRRWGTLCDGRSCGPQRQSTPFRVSRKPSWVSKNSLSIDRSCLRSLVDLGHCPERNTPVLECGLKTHVILGADDQGPDRQRPRMLSKLARRRS
jgi:hypothetical protein